MAAAITCWVPARWPPPSHEALPAEQTGCPGTVILYGCPGEEGVASKAYMAREGLWYGLDAALTWHAGDCNEVATGSANSCIQMLYTFHGLASQASTAPAGRSALDAVELMNGRPVPAEHCPMMPASTTPSWMRRRRQLCGPAPGQRPLHDPLQLCQGLHGLHQRVDKIAQARPDDRHHHRAPLVDGLSDTTATTRWRSCSTINFCPAGRAGMHPPEH